MLREWQAQCLLQASQAYSSGQRDFLTVATPGAGKTFFAATLCKHRIDAKQSDYVICLVPSLAVKNSVQETFERVLQKPFDGKYGAIGECMTYQAFQSVSKNLSTRLSDINVMLVLDEIHHCAGTNECQATAWARPLLSFINEISPKILSLSGTPFRTDKLPITTLQYGDDERVKADFVYALNDAVRDGVCRQPVVYLIDNSKWRVTTSADDIQEHDNIAGLLENKCVVYQHVLEDESFLTYLLKVAEEKLVINRGFSPDAGGLVVASTISHAKNQ